MITYPTNKLQKVLLGGGCEQNGTPTPDTPIDIVCNNGAVKVDNQGNIYTQGTQEVVTDNLGNTANAERLLGISNYKDKHSVLDGKVTRRIGIKVLDGTEQWDKSETRTNTYVTPFTTLPNITATNNLISSHFRGATITSDLDTDGYIYIGGAINLSISTSICTTDTEFKQWLADQYANGTPVIIVYPLATATTEQVTPQPLAGSSVTQTAGSIDNLPIESSTIAELKKRYIGDKEVNKVYIGNNLVYEQ